MAKTKLNIKLSKQSKVLFAVLGVLFFFVIFGYVVPLRSKIGAYSPPCVKGSDDIDACVCTEGPYWFSDNPPVQGTKRFHILTGGLKEYASVTKDVDASGCGESSVVKAELYL